MTEAGVGTLYTLWQNDNSSVAVNPEGAPLVERAMKLWAERRQDTWLGLEIAASGAEYGVLASTITSCLLTTPEQRAQQHIRDKAMEDERLELRRLAGFIESE